MVVGEFTESADVVVIGGGPGGYVAAIRAAQLGRTVTLIESQDIGGVCLNRGCIPSKALITQADRFSRWEAWAQAGLEGARPTVNWEKLQSWKNDVVNQLTGGVRTLLEGNGVHVEIGTARFVGPNQIRIAGEYESKKMTFNACIVATGSRPREVPELDIDGERVIGSTEALSLENIPGHLVVVGGGYIGLELGTAYRKLGSEVTVIEATEQLLPGVDPELVRVVARRLKRLGVTVLVNAKVAGVERTKDQARLTVSSPSGEQSLLADKVLVTVGRVPNTDQLDLGKAGIIPDDRGFIPVDSAMRTQNAKIYAIGDVVGNPMLAHKASHEGKVAAEVIAGKPAAMDVVAIPAVIFTDPEIATVGLTAKAAQDQGYDIVLGRFPFAANGRALTLQETEGQVVVVAEKTSERLLGVHIVGAEASGLIAEATLALEMGATLTDLALTIHAHPTLPETILESAEMALGWPTHVLAKKA